MHFFKKNFGSRENEKNISKLKAKIRYLINQRSNSSALRLIGSICLEKNEDWITGKKYLNMDYLRNLNKMKKEKENKKILTTVT
ncbi:MAG TPA: hypothetical protein DCY00_07125 [Actinobacteria bacterium]|nr:hypothetical protein [Actinomycetota bacterium]